MNVRIGSTILVAAGALGLSACDDDTTIPIAMETFEVTIENVSPAYDFAAAGTFDTPMGEATPGPIVPGGSYEFEISAAPGSYLTFATMTAQSNDWFFAPDGDGIALWDGAGVQVSGDVTDQVLLWDASTEVNQEPGLGLEQAPRQSGPNVGTDEDGVVGDVMDAFSYPATTDFILVTVTPVG